jgi:hypothetical protein
MWCVPAIDGEYVARMEDVLDLYTEPPDPSFPVICFDESPTQLIGEKRLPIPARADTRERYDFEYRRNGTPNLFGTMCLERRIGDRATLEREVAIWVRQRNASKARVRWLFDVDQARRKLARAYPTPARHNVESAALGPNRSGPLWVGTSSWT